ncbi:hypothetical protein JAAARDRAFT_535447 [Jaapia argillacea MUCL 33604]|uniref:Uncharacterized protein n=1 Tax=Jaapia argillacea MUCL 33604 TaxID=933084 RepID=A0A067P8J2_9AGAM|nr:hypothetical protein JAAARDRAFT_535447 [Jaapia argillacea MUCL 33604]
MYRLELTGSSPSSGPHVYEGACPTSFLLTLAWAIESCRILRVAVSLATLLPHCHRRTFPRPPLELGVDSLLSNFETIGPTSRRDLLWRDASNFVSVDIVVIGIRISITLLISSSSKHRCCLAEEVATVILYDRPRRRRRSLRLLRIVFDL